MLCGSWRDNFFFILTYFLSLQVVKQGNEPDEFWDSFNHSWWQSWEWNHLMEQKRMISDLSSNLGRWLWPNYTFMLVTTLERCILNLVIQLGISDHYNQHFLSGLQGWSWLMWRLRWLLLKLYVQIYSSHLC